MRHAVTAAAALSLALPGGAAAADVTLKHRASGFAITAPAGSRLTVSKGVYVVRRGALTITFSRAVTSATPTQFGTALLGQLGGKVVSRKATRSRFTAEVDVGSRRETIVATRRGSTVAVTTGTSPRRSPVRLATVSRIGATAKGGVSLRPPRSSAPKPLAMTSYRAPDGGATAQVPAGAEWQISSSQGAMAGFAANRGSFLLGYSINLVVPGSVPPGTSTLVLPYMDALTALQGVLPRLTVAQGVSDIRVRSVMRQNVFPTFTSSAMVLFDYRVNGAPWTGMATIATDDPSKYSNFAWNFYYSGIGVPAGTSSAVGQALLQVWRTWDPSGAIAQRTQQAKQLIDDTNRIWQQVSEFRSVTADRQARDVGCLLRGYYDVEDNSRKYDLPPLPCGQIYVKGA